MPGVLRNTLKPFGKARQKCIEMLEEIGIRVDMCYPAVGHWRTSVYADGAVNCEFRRRPSRDSISNSGAVKNDFAVAFRLIGEWLKKGGN